MLREKLYLTSYREALRLAFYKNRYCEKIRARNEMIKLVTERKRRQKEMWRGVKQCDKEGKENESKKLTRRVLDVHIEPCERSRWLCDCISGMKETRTGRENVRSTERGDAAGGGDFAKENEISWRKARRAKCVCAREGTFIKAKR